MALFDHDSNEDVYQFPSFFPTPDSDNLVICITDKGSEKPFMAMMIDKVVDLHLVGAGSSAQCFPLYTYDEDGGNRRENITDGPWSASASATPPKSRRVLKTLRV